jgi:hypothetical protein
MMPAMGHRLPSVFDSVSADCIAEGRVEDRLVQIDEAALHGRTEQ